MLISEQIEIRIRNMLTLFKLPPDNHVREILLLLHLQVWIHAQQSYTLCQGYRGAKERKQGHFASP